MAEANVGNVYVTVVPTMRGFSKEMNRQLSGLDVKKSGRKIGEAYGSSIANSMADKLLIAGNSITSLGDKLSSLGGKLTSGVTVPLLGAAAAAGTFALKTASAAETSEVSFTTMLGSAEAAQDMMQTLADFAARTPFELSGLQTATRQLLAYGFTAEDVIPTLTAVGDATAALGTGQAGIESVTRALGQMQTRGKVSAEEMLQLTEAGIPAWQYLAEAIGTDTAGAMQKVTDGAVSASEGIAAITQGMERDFGGMMEAQSKTVEGLMSNLSDAIEQPLMALRDTEAYSDFADALADVVDEAGPFVESLLPHLEDGLEVVSDVLEGAADAMESFSDMSYGAQSDLIGLVGAAAAAGPALKVAGEGLKLLGTGAKGIGSFLGAGSKAVGNLSEKLLDLATAPKTADTMLGKLAETLTGAVGPLSAVAKIAGIVLAPAIAGMAQEAAEADERQRLLTDATKDASEVMGDARASAYDLGDALGSIEPDVNGVLEKLADVNSSVGDAFSDLYVDDAKLGQYLDAIDQLANKSDLSATQQYRLKEAVEGYNDIVGTQYEVIDAVNGKISDQDGVIQENTDQINANAQAWRDRATAEAYQNVATKYMEAEADAAYNLQVAQEELNRNRERYNELASKENKTGDEIVEYNRLKQEIKDCEQNVSDLSAAYDTASQNAEQFGDWAAINASNASDATKKAAMSLSDHLNDMGDAFDDALSGMGYDLIDLSLKLAEAGVSSAELDALGSGHIRSLADSCEGDVNRMVWAIQNYNNVPIIEKDGTVSVDDAELIDAQGRLVEWNGTELVCKDTQASVDDGDLVDAQGRVYTWNGTSLEPKSTSVTVDTSSMISAKQLWDRISFGIKRTSVNAYINNVPVDHATGGIRTHADGGVIATKAVPLDIVGEDGAEAIVPLTNKRYVQPFADVVADGVARRTSTEDVVAAINALREDLSKVGVYLDSGKLVGGISRDVNRSLGRIQRRGSLA